jgi:hypothetical protein
VATESVEVGLAADPGLGYLLRRLAVHLGAREDLFMALAAAGARADGWLAVEALGALTGQLASRRVRGLRLGGPSQGRSGEEPDLELEVDGRPLALRLLSVPVAGERGLESAVAEDGELVRQLRLAGGREAGALLAVLYPLRPDDETWTESIPELERASGTRMAQQVQVLLAGPDRVTVSLWVREDRA